jgi:hypothetical protein
MRPSLPLLLVVAACLPSADASGPVRGQPAGDTPTDLVLDPAPPAPPAPPPVVVAPPEPPAPAALEYRSSVRSLEIRSRPDAAAPRRGLTAEGGVFRVLEHVTGPGCAAGWARLEADGFLCLANTEVVTSDPVQLPAMVTFDPPRPEEFESYMATGLYDHGQPDALTPAVYAKRWRRFTGKLYSSLEAYESGATPVGQLTPGAGMKYRFEEIVPTTKGEVLTRSDGQVARIDDVYLYPITRWKGRDFPTEPPPEGLWPAITVDYEGAQILAEPRADAAVLQSLPFHTPLWVEREPVSADGHWWRIPDAGGPGIPGYAEDGEALRHPTSPPSLPDGVGAEDLWVDIDLSQQGLMVRRGQELVYWTVIASGAPPMGTPLGTYRILAKYAYKDMQSRPDAEDVYRVEDVPWTMIFRPAYALHAAYWHWGFGHVASHGCVNLAVRDAKELFERLGIGLPAGWLAIFPTESESVVVRVRRTTDVGRDRRAEFSSL